MSNEFISAKDLPVTEAEEVDVLCVENGELKRKSGANLGGGDTEWDAVIEAVGGTSIGSAELSLASGSYDAVKAKIEAGEIPNVLIKWSMVYGTTYAIVARPATVAIRGSDEAIYIVLGESYAGTQRMTLNSDGTVTAA